MMSILEAPSRKGFKVNCWKNKWVIHLNIADLNPLVTDVILMIKQSIPQGITKLNNI